MEKNIVKKTLLSITLGFITVTMMAQEGRTPNHDMIYPPILPPRRLNVSPVNNEAERIFLARQRQFEEEKRNQARAIMEKSVTDDEALREVIKFIYEMSHMAIVEFVSYTRFIARDVGVPRERLIKVLEELIHENLSVIDKGGADIHAPRYTNHLIILLGTFPGYDIFPLVERCFKTNNDAVQYGAIIAYLNLEGVKAIPYLQKNIQLERYNSNPNNRLSDHLQRVVENFEKNNQTVDVEKMNVFINKLKQAQSKPANETILNSESSVYINETEQPNHETPPKQPEKSSSKKILFGFSVVAILVFIGGVVAWRKKA